MSGSHRDALRYLQRDPLRHVLHLKMLSHQAHQVEVMHVARDSAEGVLLVFPTSSLFYDKQVYPDFNVVAMPVADSAEVFSHLLDRAPQSGVIFKLIQESDEALVDARFSGAREGLREVNDR